MIEELDQLDGDTRSLMIERAELADELAELERSIRKDNEKLLLKLLDIKDGLERIFGSIAKKEDKITPQTKIWIGNFRAVYKMLQRTLEDEQVIDMDVAGNLFDPYWHKAEETVVDPAKPNDTIVKVLVKGYLHKNKLLRKPDVVIVYNDKRTVGEAATTEKHELSGEVVTWAE